MFWGRGFQLFWELFIHQSRRSKMIVNDNWTFMVLDSVYAIDRLLLDFRTLPIKVVQSFANACISTHLSHIIDSINNGFLISRIFEVEYLGLSQIAPRLTRKLHKSDLSGTFIDSNMDPYAKNSPKYDGEAY